MRTRSSKRRFTGLLLVLFGSVLFLRVTGFLEGFNIPPYFFSWQMILIILGVFFLVSRANRSTGFFLILVGGVFLAREILDMGLREIMFYLVPSLFIITGLLLIFSRSFFERERESTARQVTDSGSDIDIVHIFSGGKRIIQSELFRGGEVVCIFGGADIHFRNTTLSPDNNVLHVFCLFGGCDIFVPDDWVVRPKTTTVFGEQSDKRHRIPGPASDDKARPTLTIRGTLFFGGVDIKSE